ncbi:MAG TPA: glycosyltransferase family 1 protein [Candidatus Binatia bacterium]|jgi:glycosyltransferase involved in cell wall biosynthesis|nr:glycosyltransferase family 1 protein [Candidatus Binatia bacterium]
MKIGIDCSLVPGERLGIGQYAYQLVQALSRIDQENTYLLYPVFYYTFHPRYRQARLPHTPNMGVAFRWLPRAVLRALRHSRAPWFTREWLLGRVDVVHSVSFSAPRFRSRRKRLVVTIPDLSFLTHPEYHTPENVAHALRGTHDAVAWADALIAISEHTRQDLIERMRVPATRVVVTYLAPNPLCVREEDPRVLSRTRAAYGLPAHFVLFVGSLEPRKNIKRLLAAYASLPPTLRREVHVVIVGGRGWLNDDIRPTVGALGLTERVHFVGYIKEEDLPAVYSLATVFAYPSLYEGFGLPVLEAMQCGTPVLTSNVSALPEVVGDAALLVTPTEVEEIAEGLTRLLERTDLRTDLRARGYQRVREFSWARCARETLAVYRRVSGAS